MFEPDLFEKRIYSLSKKAQRQINMTNKRREDEGNASQDSGQLLATKLLMSGLVVISKGTRYKTLLSIVIMQQQFVFGNQDDNSNSFLINMLAGY